MDPDVLKLFLAVTSAVAHLPTNEKTWPFAEREGEHVSPLLARTHGQASASASFPTESGDMVWHQGVTLRVAGRE